MLSYLSYLYPSTIVFNYYTSSLSSKLLEHISYSFIGFCLNTTPGNIFLFYKLYQFIPLFYTLNNLRKKSLS